MFRHDIGIDLGTASVIIHVPEKGVVLHEPSVVAVDAKTGTPICFGTEASDMIGKTPGRIEAIRPLADGVISDHRLTEEMLRHFIRRIAKQRILRPRICVCVPSGITEVESRAVVEAALSTGARRVFLIEEPMAAAIGAGVDISQPHGVMVVDIGGGTADIAVISMNAIVCKTSVRIAGHSFDQAIIRFVRERYNIIIGEKTAEKIKISVASVDPNYENETITVKGRSFADGLPVKFSISTEDVYPVVLPLAMELVEAMQALFSSTPPELAGDILASGILLTGGGALLRGLGALIEAQLDVKASVASDAVDCVAIGTSKVFELLEKYGDVFHLALRYPR